jgi:hypothetical protein
VSATCSLCRSCRCRPVGPWSQLSRDSCASVSQAAQLVQEEAGHSATITSPESPAQRRAKKSAMNAKGMGNGAGREGSRDPTLAQRLRTERATSPSGNAVAGAATAVPLFVSFHFITFNSPSVYLPSSKSLFTTPLELIPTCPTKSM